MSRSVFWALVRKDLYLLRGFMIAMLVVGLVSWWTMRFGGKAFAVGGLMFLTANMGGAIFIALYTLLIERKEQARLFALSLPVTGMQYGLAKVVAAYLAFLIPWLVLTAVGLIGILAPGGAAKGLVVYGLLIQCFIVAIFSVVMAALFAVTSEPMSGVSILGVNICFSLFMMYIHQPKIMQPLQSDAIVWTPFARGMLTGELLAITLPLGLILYLMFRRRDYI